MNEFIIWNYIKDSQTYLFNISIIGAIIFDLFCLSLVLWVIFKLKSEDKQ